MGLIDILLLVPVVCGAQDAQVAAKELRYSGTLEKVVRGSDDNVVKRFDLYCVLSGGTEGQSDIFFLLDERGGGGWEWPKRYGRVRINQFGQRTSDDHIALRYDTGEQASTIPFREYPLFPFADKIKSGNTWEDEGLEFEVAGVETMARRECSRIEVIGNFGRSHTVWVENGTSLVVALRQRAVVFAGEEFVLTMELDSEKPINGDQLARLQATTQMLVDMRKSLKLTANRTPADLTEEEFARADELARQLEKQADGTPFSRLAGVIRRDLKSQQEQTQGLERLAASFRNKPAPALNLKLLDGTVKDEARARGRVIVLHFWNYLHDPLVEPYGQVGYLDFLANRRKGQELDVYGVAVDSRLGGAEFAPPVLRSIRQLQNFMNLGYPIALDDGTLLKQFGNPPSVGAELPLWVVIGPDGTIAEYKTGFYNVKPDEGLLELDAKIEKLLDGIDAKK